MASITKLTIDTTWTSLLTTELNSLTTGSVSSLSSAVTNGTNLDIFVEFSLILGSINPSGSPYLELHMARLLADGTTYEDVYAGGPTFVRSLIVSTGSSAKAVGLSGPKALILPPGSAKFAICNQSGVTTAASGNTLSYQTYNINLNG